MRRRHPTVPGRAAAALALTLAVLAALPAGGAAATREPLARARSALHEPAAAAVPEARAPRALRRSAAAAAARPTVRSTAYGAAEEAKVETVLAGLRHGAEMSLLSVYLATPPEIAASCGATVVACYFPAQMEMVVSGVDRPVAGVPRDFAIAHEYGHHIANSQRSDLPAVRTGGTMRWATYERVCQFTRSRQLFPGGSAAHYWRDPEEAFAEAYAHLNEPGARVSWQFSPLLRPTTAALAKIEADVSRPWSGPVTRTISGTVAGPGARRPASRPAAGNGVAGRAVALGPPPSLFLASVETPLDGRVAVTVSAPAGADLAVSLRDPGSGRALARARTREGGSATVSVENCGHQSLQLAVRSRGGAGRFEASVVRP